MKSSSASTTSSSRTVTERADVCDSLPEVEAALSIGVVAAGHIDAIAVATRRLSDEAREEVGVHVGLGMTLCEKIAALLGGTIRATTPTSSQFEVEVAIPRG